MSGKNFKRLAYVVGYTFLVAGVLYGAFLWSTKEVLWPGFVSVIGGFIIWFLCWLFLFFQANRRNTGHHS